MKKLTVLLLLVSLFGHAQVDYKGLVKNIEDITLETDIKAHFKGLPFTEEYGEIKFSDERFLRFYGVFVDKVKINTNWNGRSINITTFNNEQDYKTIKKSLSAQYFSPGIVDNGDYVSFEWETVEKKITLNVAFSDYDNKEIEQRSFKKIIDLNIFFKINN